MKKFLPILFLFAVLGAQAQTLTAHKKVVPGGYDFWVYTAYDTASEPQPLILFLHGASLCGNNLERVRRYGPLQALQMGLEIPAIVVAPQNPGDAWRPGKILQVVEWVERHYPIDTNRIYVFGMSLGGYGTIDFTGTYPDKVAAAIAMCGGGQLRDFCGLNEVPLWIIHGTADRQVPLHQSQRIVDAMEQCGDTPRLQFTRLEGSNHGAPARAFYLASTYEWLLSHRLDTPGRPMTPGYNVSPNDLRGAYKHLHRSNSRIEVTKTPHSTETAIPDTTGDATYYTVRKGDTLGRIARQHHTTVARLCELNGLKQNSIIRPKQRIRVR